MLSDRDYMRGSRGNPWRMNNRQSPILPLITVNALLFLLCQMGEGGYRLQEFMMLSPAHIRQFQLWRLVTYMFAHGSVMHIFFNMWGLYFFGRLMHQTLGTARFMRLYFISGILGGLFWLLFNWNNPASAVIGASGALYGITTAAAIAYPAMQLRLLFPPVTMTMRTMAICYMLIELLQSFNVNSGIAHLAHLGGALGGFIFMCKSRGFRPVESLLGNIKAWKRRRDFRKKADVPFPDFKRQQDEEEADNARLMEVLDKIAKNGYDSLTTEELRIFSEATRKRR